MPDIFDLVIKGDLNGIKQLVNTGTSINSVDKKGFTLLHYASQLNHVDITTWLLESQADIDIREHVYGSLPIHVAAINGSLGVLQIFLQYGIAVDVADNDGRTPLWKASFDGHQACVQYLIQHGSNVNQPGHHQFTPLAIASQEGHNNIVNLLLDNKANINAVGDQGGSSLMSASKHGHHTVVNTLITRGADLELRDMYGQSALQYACYYNKLHILELLLAYRANINVCTNIGQSGLHYAAYEGHKDIVSALLLSGAKITKSNDGNTPLDIAHQEGYTEIESLLKKYTDIGVSEPIQVARVLYPYRAECEDELSLEEGHIVEILEKKSDDNGWWKGSVNGKTGVFPQSYVKLIQPEEKSDDNGWWIGSVNGKTGVFPQSYVKLIQPEEAQLQLPLPLSMRQRQLPQPLPRKIKQPKDTLFFTTKLSDSTNEKGDPLKLVCCINVHSAVTWSKNDCPLKDNVTIFESDLTHELYINATSIEDEGEYTCCLSNGTTTSCKITIKDIFADHSQKHWSEFEKKQLIETCLKRVLMAGECESGKTSLARSLRKGSAYVTKDHDRTAVLDYQSWKVSNTISIPMFDIGGHPCYSYTAHFFHSNHSNNLVLLLQDIQLENDEDYSHTFAWMKDVLAYSPKCTVIPVLTKADKVNKEIMKARKEKFKRELIKLIDKEIKNIKRQKKYRNETKHMEDVYHKLKTVFEEDEVYIVSCSQEHEDSIRRLQSKIMEFCRSDINISSEYQLFYLKLGQLGIEKGTPESTVATASHLDREGKVRSTYRAKIGKESSLGDGEDEIQTAMKDENSLGTEISMEPQSELDDKTLESQSELDDKTIDLKRDYVTYQDAYDSFCETLHKEVNAKSIDEFERCLSTFHSLGLVLWFGHIPSARHLVFKNLNYFVQILQSVFNHNLDYTLKYENLTVEQEEEVDYDKRRFELDVKKLKCTGKMSKALLRIMLGKANFQMHSDSIVDIFSTFNICAKISYSSNALEEYFFPWFAENPDVPIHLKPKLEQMKKSTKTDLVIRCDFEGAIPRILYHHLCINLFRICHCNSQERQLWKNNMWVELGDLFINLKLASEDCISMISKVYLNGDDILGDFSNMWDCISKVTEEIEIKKSTWPGLITTKSIICPHCIIINTEDPKRWDLTHHLQVGAEDIPGRKCDCDNIPKRKIPASLIHPVKKEQSQPLRSINEIKSYLVRVCDSKGIKPIQVVERADCRLLPCTITSVNLNDPVIQRLTKNVEQVYQLKSICRGRTVIINNEFFNVNTRLENRTGTQWDAQNLDNLFTNLHFTTKRYNDLTGNEILRIIEEERIHIDHTKADAFVLCILSHGEKDFVFGVDGVKVNIKDNICAPFDGDNCHTLHGKPKVFIIQACQGDKSTTGIHVDDNPVTITGISSSLELSESTHIHEDSRGEKWIHEKAEMLIAYSAVAGYVSYRDETCGTWFIRAFVEIFNKFAHEEHLQDMLIKVCSQVASCETDESKRQVTETHSSLTKKLYFFPGYFQEQD